MIGMMWKQFKHPSMDEWIKKMWYIHMIEYYSALKKKKILQYVTTLMNTEDVILSGISQSQKDEHCMILHI